MLEFQLTPNSLNTLHLWLSGLLGLSSILTISFVLSYVGLRFALTSTFDRFTKLLLAVLASVQIFAWHLYLYSGAHDTIALWCFPIAFSGGFFVWRLSNGALLIQPPSGSTVPIAILLISLAQLGGFAHATKQFSETTFSDGTLNFAADLGLPGTLVEKSEICAVTDNGKPVKLFARHLTEEAFQAHIDKCRSSLVSISEKAMLRAQPFVEANCHGWVFTQGKHILRGEDVQLILDDNNYTQVQNPQPNDVVVYRRDDQFIVHTGVVRGSLEGTIIVESKWGIGALYLHAADEQPYSQDITYYRTNRPSHNILIKGTNGEFAATAIDRYDELLADQSIDYSVQRCLFDSHLCSSQSE